jgi:hypothetical protein
MRQDLRLHPDSQCDAVTRIEVEVARPNPGLLTLAYTVTGAIADLYLPPAAPPGRVDELWRRTCFEAFVRPAPGAAYFEFNFAPSSQWAAYGFTNYRAGMSAPGEIGPPAIEARATDDRFELRVRLDLDRLPGLPRDPAWGLALAAVIEETNGRKSYWALTHPPGKPDFHHTDGFAHELQRAAPR